MANSDPFEGVETLGIVDKTGIHIYITKDNAVAAVVRALREEADNYAKPDEICTEDRASARAALRALADKLSKP